MKLSECITSTLMQDHEANTSYCKLAIDICIALSTLLFQMKWNDKDPNVELLNQLA